MTPGLHLDRTHDPLPVERDERRHTGREQRPEGLLRLLRVLGPPFRANEGDQPIEVGPRERLDRRLGHASGGPASSSNVVGNESYPIRSASSMMMPAGPRTKQSQ
jgi:hypothetical protein